MADAPSNGWPRGLAWLHHVLAISALVALVVLLYDLRREFRRTGTTVNEHLPEILEKTRDSAATLAEVSQDIRQLRDLAGATGPRDATLAKYADELLDLIEASDARIGVEAIIGSGIKDARPAREWTADARKEAVYLTFTAKSREELLERLTRNKFGRDWLIQETSQAQPVKLIEWLNLKHPS